MNMRTQQDHEGAPLSTGPHAERRTQDLSDSERANALRYVASERGGHVESHFLKANSPDGTRALWLKHTVLRKTSCPDAAVAEVWAIWFERGRDGKPPRVIALKKTVSIAELTWSDHPFSLRTAFAEFRHGSASGCVRDAQHSLAWDLTFAPPDEAFRPFPFAAMYRGPLPRTKTLTPVPNARAKGWFELDGERISLDGFRLAQGHNWGKTHAQEYAWVHGNAWQGAGTSEVFVELLSARVKLGGVVTPWLSVGAVAIDDVTYRFDRARALLSRRVRILPDAYSVNLCTTNAELVATFQAERSMIAGLRYEDPDGSSLYCLNSKLAYGEVRLTAQGRTWSFKSDQVALEVGTRKEDHGLTILV